MVVDSASAAMVDQVEGLLNLSNFTLIKHYELSD